VVTLFHLRYFHINLSIFSELEIDKLNYLYKRTTICIFQFMSNFNKSYLELSNDVSHKFYEVTLEKEKVTYRHGRIGCPGKAEAKICLTSEEAELKANKKIEEKLRKGYEHATPGLRKPRNKAT